MPTLKDAKEWIEATYNSAITVYEYKDHIRFTNGNAAYYIDIRQYEDRFVLRGARYGEEVGAECEKTKEALLDTLSSVA